MTAEEMFNGGVEQPQQPLQEEKEQYTFSTGTAEDYRKLSEEISSPKQFYNDVEQLPNEEPTENKSKVLATNTAKFVTNSIDRIMSISLSLIANDDGETDFSADDDEKKEMQEYWEAAFPDPAKQMNPVLAAVLAILLIYGLKAKNAVSIRRAKKRIEEDAKIIHQQEVENERLRKELELLKTNN